LYQLIYIFIPITKAIWYIIYKCNNIQTNPSHTIYTLYRLSLDRMKTVWCTNLTKTSFLLHWQQRIFEKVVLSKKKTILKIYFDLALWNQGPIGVYTDSNANIIWSCPLESRSYWCLYRQQRQYNLTLSFGVKVLLVFIQTATPL
jgi:hypothetical protein